jgi:hypothetical protein
LKEVMEKQIAVLESAMAGTTPPKDDEGEDF